MMLSNEEKNSVVLMCLNRYYIFSPILNFLYTDCDNAFLGGVTHYLLVSGLMGTIVRYQTLFGLN